MNWTSLRGLAWLGGLLVSVVGAASICYAHDDLRPPPPGVVGPDPVAPSRPPSPQMPYAPGNPGIAQTVRIYPPRWSWLHWWEANRDEYLTVLRQGPVNASSEQMAAEASRQRAIRTLTEATKSSAWQLRSTAAGALGRIGEPQSLAVLKKLATDDPQSQVRQTALLAIGLLDTPQAEGFLVQQARQRPALAGLGLLSKCPLQTLQGLQGVLDGRDAPSAILAIWAIRQQVYPYNGQFFRGVLRRRESPWLASEALLGLGRTEPGAAIPVLADMLLLQGSVRQVAAYRYLERVHREKSDAYHAALQARQQYKEDYQQYLRQFEAYLQASEQWRRQVDPNWQPSQTTPTPDRPYLRDYTFGIEAIYLSSLRASAAIALGRIDHPQSRKALLAALRQPDNKFSNAYKTFVLISLGRIGDGPCAEALALILNPRGGIRSHEVWDSPVRGCAAIGLGLYARPVETADGPVDRPGFEAVCQLLGRHLANAGESPEVRAACAVALGLTARTENLRYLQRGIPAQPMQDESLSGYVLLARGMLGDRNILEPAAALLARANERTDMAGTLARRAAVLGVGLTGRREAIPILREAWHLGYYVNREVIPALALCGGQDLGLSLAETLETSTNLLEQAYMAQCLGLLHEKVRPGRLARFTRDSNYTIRNEPLAIYQSYANEFLFCYLIPQFKEEWR